jgi:signal transduction histidine kinase
MKARYLLFFLILGSFVYAQNDDSPSALLFKLKEAKEDSVITDLYNQLGQYYYKDKYDSAYYYYNKGLAIARKNDIQSEIAYLLASKARVIIYEGNYDAAIDTLKKSLDIFNRVYRYHAISDVYISLGVVFYNKSMYDSCKYYWGKGLSVYKKLNDSAGIATVYSNIGVVNYVQGNAEVALKNYLKALEIRKKLGSTNSLASIYMKIALIYQKHFNDNMKSYEYVSEAISIYRRENNKLGEAKALINLGNTLENLDSTKRAMDILNQAMSIAEEIKNKRLLATGYSLMGTKLTNQHQYRKALEYLYKARSFNEEMGQVRELAKTHSVIGEIFYQLADYNTASSYFEKSLEFYKNLNLHAEMSYVYFSLSETAAKMNNYNLAYEYYQNYTVQKDSVSIHENKELLAEMEAKYANQQNEQKIAFLEKEQVNKDEQLRKSNIIRNLLFGMAVLVLAIALLFFQRFRQKVIINKELRERNKKIAEANKEIQQNASNIKEFNRLLMEKNEVIEQQNKLMSESNETKDRIISIIGHDLRSPMANIHTSLKLLTSKDFTKDKIDHMYRLMENDVNSGMDLLENLLMWVKNQEGRMKLQKEEQAFNPVVEKTINSLTTIAQNKNIELIYIKAEQDIAYFDKPMISAVLRNLITNAIKFTTQGGLVQVNASQKDNFLHVSVADNGIGMDEQTIEKISTKNSYYTQKGTNKEKGSGLGLSLCFDIVKMHQGILHIESQPGKGSVFTFTIPLKSID